MSPIPKTFQDQFLGLDFSYSKTTLEIKVLHIYLVRIYYYLVDLLQMWVITANNIKLKFSKYMQNISRSKSFGKFVLIVWHRNFGQAKIFWILWKDKAL